jgi:hypothetical protein
MSVGMSIKALILVVVFSSGWMTNGWRLGENIAKNKAEQAEQAVEIVNSIIRIERLNREKAEAISAKTTAEELAQTVRATTIREEVLVYVQNPNTGTCSMPDGWVQSHDKATGVSYASNTPSPPPSIPTRTITDREALIAVTENYNVCQQNAVRHSGLIDWAKAMTNLSSNIKE